MFELGQLRCFLAVATERSFSRAAVRLNMTQPPLSRQIQLLEHQLGIRLFDRTTRSVVLTAAGRAFFIEAQDLLERAHSAAFTARKVAQGDIGTVTISFVSSAVYEFLPNVIAEGRKSHPHINIALREMTTAEQLEALRLHRTDIGIVRSPLDQQGFGCECLVREKFVLAVPREHSLATQRQVTLRDLDDQPFIIYALSSWQPFHELMAGMFRSAEVRPEFVQHIGSTLTILALVNTGMGLALVPESATKIRFDNTRFRDIELPPGVLSLLYLVWRVDNDNPAFQVMLTAIRKSVHTLPNTP
ncbi:LysR family transcriptional regulator [Sodalis ligni]|uniref:LysR family transcriptional regulator n=1 Tax=Sodalis ligni TaxID=2697027 RepID=A0A4R1N9A1_9GAMM|nr:LysR family transcriptional regulator [Sodalis ligni]TCL02091.1 LysR family transcriptional regulator [Sodalis ligni]